MDYYSHTNNKIYVAHFPGETRKIEKDLLTEFSNRIITKPDNLDIVCVMTKDHKDTAPLIKQLNASNVKYYNYIEDRDLMWNREEKVYYVLESLKMCDKEYTLILDGDDVAILTDLDGIIKEFNSYNKNIIYNATIWMYPHIIIEHIENRRQYGDYCFLNAGCCIGKTSDLIDFYEEVWDLIKYKSNPINSEQYYIRKVFGKHQDTVFFDYDCRIFQCWHKPRYEYKTIDGEERCYLM